MGTALLVAAASVAPSCGGNNLHHAANGDSGFEPTAGTGGGSNGSGGSPSAATGSAATGDTSSAGGAAGVGTEVPDTCSGTPVYEANWTDVSQADGPSPRLAHAMADTPDGVVLFGGGSLLLGGLDDTWVWDGGEWQASDTVDQPPGRAGHDMVFADNGAVLFGGDGGDLLDDLWLYADGDWTELCADDTCGSAPAPRSGLAISYDRARGKLVLFGGFDGESALQDTWEWDPEGGWNEICGNDCEADFCCEPPPRHDHRMLYDSLGQRILMFGGTDDDSELDDIWAYDGDGWHAVDAPGPSARAGHTFAFDAAHGLALLFGGTRDGNAVPDDAWVFDVRDDAWAPLESSGPAPQGRAFAAMAFDRQNEQFVLFGGGDSGQFQDTWTMSFEVAGCLGAGGAAGAAGAANPDPADPGP